MDIVLNQSLLNFKRELNAALAIINGKPIPPELGKLKQWLIAAYQDLATDLNQLEYVISLKDPIFTKTC